jgi:hypothetical protein
MPRLLGDTKSEDFLFCDYKVYGAYEESKIVSSMDLLSGSENEDRERRLIPHGKRGR